MHRQLLTYSNQDATIHEGDVLDCFPLVSDGSIDLVFADPPYNIGKDFGHTQDKLDDDVYLHWMKRWMSEIHRVLKPNGSAYIMNSTQNLAHMDLFAREKFYVISRIVWSYDSSGVQAKSKFGSMWEPILHLVKSESDYVFNSKDIEVEAKTGAQRQLIDYRKTPPQPYNTKKVPGNVWDFPRVRFRMDEYENHPTQKPLSLLDRIVRASSNPGDLVLDPFSGSFSTGDSCLRLGRRFIGFEINHDYVKIGLRRLSIPSNYSEEELFKEKVRKTKNKSKKDHIAAPDHPTLFD